MGSQKQSHRIRKNNGYIEAVHKHNDRLLEYNKALKCQNNRLAHKLAYYENRPPVWKIAAYTRWRKEAEQYGTE